ncbi:hypothetical protein D3C81_1738280 [compost metagenome]
MVAQYCAQRQFSSQGLALLHLGKDRRFMQPTAQVYRQQAEDPAEQEWNAPREFRDLLSAIKRVDRGGHQRAQQDTGGKAAGQAATGVSDMPWWHMLGDEHPGTWDLTANCRALDDAHQQQQDRRPQANLRIRRQ